MIRSFGFRAAESADIEPGSPIRFVASQPDKARDGMSIDVNAWNISDFKANPVIMAMHDYGSWPVGKATVIEKNDKALIADIVFDQEDPNAVMIESKIRRGFLNAVSVGFNITEIKDTTVTKAELLEISIVPIPADPKALAERQTNYLRSFSQELAALADESPPPASTADESARSSWEETSAAMVDLFQPYGLRSDNERREDFDRLARDYGRHKRTPPEFATAVELEAFDQDALCGRFLEGEADLHADLFTRMDHRAGAVLSRKNLDDLSQAVTLIHAVMDRSAKEPVEPEPDDSDERAATEILSRFLNKKGY
jgi:HK97 family phage prohead protease